MANIELVIKMPEEVYRYAKKYNVSSMLALREINCKWHTAPKRTWGFKRSKRFS